MDTFKEQLKSIFNDDSIVQHLVDEGYKSLEGVKVQLSKDRDQRLPIFRSQRQGVIDEFIAHIILNQQQARESRPIMTTFIEQLKSIFNDDSIVQHLVDEGYKSLGGVKVQLSKDRDQRLPIFRSQGQGVIDDSIAHINTFQQGLGDSDPLGVYCNQPFFLAHYIERESYTKRITEFLESNIDAHKKTRKNEHYFLYIINGSGLGKTWSGKHACNMLIQSSNFNTPLRFKCFVDFSNGFRYDQQIDGQCPSSASLALRVAASLLGKSWKDLFFRFQSRIHTFTLEYVMTWFVNKVRQATSPNQLILFAIHLDEIQTNSLFTQSLLHEIGNFMCFGDESVAQKLNIVLFPILTGTSSSDLKPGVTGFGSIHIHLKPFTSSAINNQYKITQSWEDVCKTRDNLNMVVALSLSNFDVYTTHVLPDLGLTIEDVSRGGIIFLEPTTGSRFGIVYPLIVLELLNRSLHFTSVDLMEPLNPHWGWKKFEQFEASFELLKNNSHALAGWTVSSIESYYSKCSPISPLRDREFKFTMFDGIAVEEKQFLKKDVKLKPIHEIEEDELFNHSFICKTGNPCVDTRVFREQADQDTKPWMFCKQLKHTQNDDHTVIALGSEALASIYQEFKDRLGDLREKFRIVYIFFTNKVVHQDELDHFYQNHTGAIIIHRDNIVEYLQASFSLFSVTDDDDDEIQDRIQSIGYNLTSSLPSPRLIKQLIF